jgi:hypothetical protein
MFQMRTFLALYVSTALAMAIMLSTRATADSSEAPWLGDGNDVSRFKKSLGTRITVHGWLCDDSLQAKGPAVILDDQTHDGIGIEAISRPKSGESILKLTWTGWMTVYEECFPPASSSKTDEERMKDKIKRLRETYKLNPTRDHPSESVVRVTVSGTICHLKVIYAGIENHRRCSMPQSHMFFSVDDVKILPEQTNEEHNPQKPHGR